MSDPKVIKETTLLDLPMKRQLEIAKRDNLSHSDWVSKVKAHLKRMEEHSAKFQWGVRPKGFTEEDAERFTEKCQSGHGTEKSV